MHPYLEGLLSSSYVVGAVLCVVLVAIVYYISSRYKTKKCRKGKATDESDDELTEIQKAISAIESAQKVESGTTRKPAPDAGPIADAAVDMSEGM